MEKGIITMCIEGVCENTSIESMNMQVTIFLIVAIVVGVFALGGFLYWVESLNGKIRRIPEYKSYWTDDEKERYREIKNKLKLKQKGGKKMKNIFYLVMTILFIEAIWMLPRIVEHYLLK